MNQEWLTELLAGNRRTDAAAYAAVDVYAAGCGRRTNTECALISWQHFFTVVVLKT